MSIRRSIKRVLSFLLNGAPTNVTANVFYLNPNNQLLGKKIIVTGGSRGLGYAMAKKFTEEGADVLITGRNEDTLLKSANEIGCKYLKLDIQDVDAFDDFIKKADESLHGIDILFNNAGLSLHEKSFLSVDNKMFEDQFNTNLKGPFFLSQSYIRLCQEYKREGIKKILFTSSETSMTVDERPYGLSKAALNSLIQGIACRYVKDGFRINGIAPGITASEMTGFDPSGNLYLDINPTNRVYLPEEIAEIACFLCTDASNIINGQIIYCNEGRTINTRW